MAEKEFVEIDKGAVVFDIDIANSNSKKCILIYVLYPFVDNKARAMLDGEAGEQ